MNWNPKCRIKYGWVTKRYIPPTTIKKEITKMKETREITAKELSKIFEGKTVNVIPTDYYGISIEFSKARIEYDEANCELSFTAGNFNHDGIASISIEEDNIKSIVEENGEYVISFMQHMADITVSEFKSLAELEKEHAERIKE